jgi:hypothetical protein
MKNYYITKQMTIHTDNREQTAPSGRKFRLSGVVKDMSKPETWVEAKKEYCRPSTIKFVYLDDLMPYFLCLDIEANDNLIRYYQSEKC